MARDVDLKKIELNVSLTCCDGCKRKVKKALRNIEGVLETEIDHSKPKVTVLGNVDPQVLIKRLLKVGKQAQVSSFQDYKNESLVEVKIEKERVAEVTKEQEKVKSKVGYEEEKHAEPFSTKVEEKNKDSNDGGKGGKNNGSSNKDEPEIYTTNHPSEFQEIGKENFGVPQPQLNMTLYPNTNDASNIKNQPQYCYIAEPCAVAIPYYARPSYMAPPPPATIHSYGQPQPYLEFEKLRPPQPTSMVPAVRVGDYFSDENTVGCSVM